MDIQGTVGSRVTNVGQCDHTTAITVTSTAAKLTLTAGKTTVEMMNTGDNTVYYGGVGVTDVTGFPIYRRSWHSWSTKKNWSIYVVCAAGETSTLRRVEYV